MTAQPDSQRARLHSRIAAQRETPEWDLAIPNTEPVFYGRFRALPVRDLMKGAPDEKMVTEDPEKALRKFAAIVRQSCVGLFDLGPDDKPVSLDPADPDGPWPTFHEADRLRDLFGLESHHPLQLVTDICTEAGVLLLGAEIGKRSGISPGQQVDELGKSSEET